MRFIRGCTESGGRARARARLVGIEVPRIAQRARHFGYVGWSVILSELLTDIAESVGEKKTPRKMKQK